VPDSPFELDGALTMAEAPQVYQRSLAALKAGTIPETVDLSRLGRTDSSALAVLLTWQSAAQRQNRRIEFLSPPESLRMLAGLSQSGDLLGWTQADSESEEAS
jgi:ABC-type transporter Mla MlaB component